MPSHKHDINYGIQIGGNGSAYVYSTNEGQNEGMIHATGGNQAHNNLQPYIVTNYIIKAFSSSVIEGSVLSTKSNSTKNTYSCDYVNNLVHNEMYSDQKILFEDTGGTYMGENQVANLSENISQQKNGIVLIWQPYRSGSGPTSWGWNITFIPKYIAQNFPGYGFVFNLTENNFGEVSSKYIYVFDNRLVGNVQILHLELQLVVILNIIMLTMY